MKKLLQGVDIWILQEDKLLIQKRSSSRTRHPNKWAMTGGKIEDGENAIEAIIRECQEELNISIDSADLTYLEEHVVDDINIKSYLLETEINLENLTLQEEEVSEVKYATTEEIDLLSLNREFIPFRWEYVRDKIISKKKDNNPLIFNKKIDK